MCGAEPGGGAGGTGRETPGGAERAGKEGRKPGEVEERGAK